MIQPSELIINQDGSVFHLHLRPEQLADKLIVCGDPERVGMIASYFDTVECDVSSREFRTITGTYKGKRITALSHGIGPDNIDIVMTELDALKNIDFSTREPRPEHRTMDIVRIGTCGGLQPFASCGSYIISRMSIGFDGVLSWYADRDRISDTDFERRLVEAIAYPPKAARPYVVHADETLADRIAQGTDMIDGATISAVGFYGPQGRVVRLPLASPGINERISAFEYKGRRITNYEMESAPLAGLSALLGHRAVTVCLVVANRVSGDANASYKGSMPALIQTVLERI